MPWSNRKLAACVSKVASINKAIKRITASSLSRCFNHPSHALEPPDVGPSPRQTMCNWERQHKFLNTVSHIWIWQMPEGYRISCC